MKKKGHLISIIDTGCDTQFTETWQHCLLRKHSSHQPGQLS